MTASKRRLDELLCERGLAESPKHAQALVLAHEVLVDNVPARSPAVLIDQDAKLRLRHPPKTYVGRGGYKLAAALDAFSIDVSGLIALDVGASTGGFTDCLLKRGASKVYAVDVGYGLLAMSLRQDSRVVVCERTHILHLPPKLIAEPIAVAVLDVSFIGLRQVLPVVPELLAPVATVVALIKPQFELPRERVGDGGIVRDPSAWDEAQRQVLDAAAALGWTALGTITSPIEGAAGNREFLAAWRTP